MSTRSIKLWFPIVTGASNTVPYSVAMRVDVAPELRRVGMFLDPTGTSSPAAIVMRYRSSMIVDCRGL